MMRELPVTFLIEDVQDYWNRVEYRSPHDPESIAEREQRRAEARARLAAMPKPKKYSKRLEDRFAQKRKAAMSP
ncbi:MAG: hypothetical protein EPN70_23095 [Paraburkholderia sp.]|uniref:hypothetical protein n=1 Tax=Paraburkholderia sp. TaxID=1926495 RepID=UPI00121540A6|nr:hypothetical protein [Paraburkholderia sp.]TAM00139.1 MAG: hypothetical protein EPN70_23095 [Paraburkholderia sp.]TAM32598.1 MAG: hypothetical protein EPN59_01495 [Paraburkholderia sp.]